jgi:precorrin-2 dehydrogenase/sirohydrochlorin ferrochelatase
MVFYPINLNITNQLCVVIGGGTVATRKVTDLLACNARVRVISPEISPDLQQFTDQKNLEWIPRAYQTGDLQGAALAFAVTDQPEVQRQAAAEAGIHAIPINIGDNPEACTFQIPATVRQGDLLISISTGGSSPALASTIRKELEQRYGPEYGHLVKLLGAIRKLSIGQESSPNNHKILLAKILQSNILSHLKNKQWAELHASLLAILPAEMNVDSLIPFLTPMNGISAFRRHFLVKKQENDL